MIEEEAALLTALLIFGAGCWMCYRAVQKGETAYQDPTLQRTNFGWRKVR